MSIPDEVIDKATRRLWFNNVSNDWATTATEIYRMCEESVRVVAPVIAEWARREALREAAEAIRFNAGEEDENGIREGVSLWPDASARTYSFATHEAIEAVRALAEGERND